jgi:uncharacterized glyoxalase superfamily protein PhnB
MTQTQSGGGSIKEVFTYFRVRDAAKAIEFYNRAFGAEEIFRLNEPGGRDGHAEIRIGGTVVMLADEHPEYGILGPESVGGTTFGFHLHVDNADAFAERAIAAGATLIRPLADQFYGERSGVVRDPFGHEWMLGHQIEQVSPEEMQRRYTELVAGSGG